MTKENNDILIKVENLSKKFCKDLKTSLWYGVKDLSANIFGNQQPLGLREKEFWAVKDINFTLRRGECLGLIGHNGAGKSTLLKILNGLINPDEGKVTIKGKVGALIELGAGFNPILSGRENIYNNGAILGFTKAEIDDKVEAIIDFSEIREFIDMPVQNYSSGMKVRLGFAVAAQMEPDVLIIDEVLAVGDAGFRMKCLNEINKLMANTAVIFVSHSMPQISKISSKVLLMNNGKPMYLGDDISNGIEMYFNKFDGGEYFKIENGLTLEKINVKEKLEWSIPGNNLIDFNYLEDLIISFKINNKKKIEKAGFIIRFFDRSLISVATCQNRFEIINNTFTIKIPKLQLGTGVYDLDIYFVEYDKLDNEMILAHYKNFISLKVKKSKISNHSSFQLISEIL